MLSWEGGGEDFNKIIIFLVRDCSLLAIISLTQSINSRLTSRKSRQPFIEASISQAIHLHEVEVKAIEDENCKVEMLCVYMMLNKSLEDLEAWKLKDRGNGKLKDFRIGVLSYN